MAIGKNCEVFVWGDGSQGQLGRDNKISNKPIEVQELQQGCFVKNGYLILNKNILELVERTIVL